MEAKGKSELESSDESLEIMSSSPLELPAPQSGLKSKMNYCSEILWRPLINDDTPLRLVVGGKEYLVIDTYVIRYIKLVCVSLFFMTVMRAVYENIYRMEYQISYSYYEFYQLDFHVVLFELLAFMILGRVHLAPGVDCLAYIFSMFAMAGFFMSLATIKTLQISLDAKSMAKWGAGTWIGVIVIIAVVIFLVGSQFYASYKKKILTHYVTVICIEVALLVGPHIGDGTYHLHHWFYGWLLGTCANHEDSCLSRVLQACALSLYLVGIAAYGRDPLAGPHSSGEP
jgi:hypothetical protein